MPVAQYIRILLALLLLALFMERYCFAVAVYKIKNYGGILILTVIIFNTIFLYVIQRLRNNKQRKKLHELYKLERAPKVGVCIVAVIGGLDMMKSFLFFWSANVMPIWLLITLLQLKIPLTTIMRGCCIDEVRHYLTHWIAALVILVGCVVNMLTLTINDRDSVSTIFFCSHLNKIARQ